MSPHDHVTDVVVVAVRAVLLLLGPSREASATLKAFCVPAVSPKVRWSESYLLGDTCKSVASRRSPLSVLGKAPRRGRPDSLSMLTPVKWLTLTLVIARLCWPVGAQCLRWSLQTFTAATMATVCQASPPLQRFLYGWWSPWLVAVYSLSARQQASLHPVVLFQDCRHLPQPWSPHLPTCSRKKQKARRRCCETQARLTDHFKPWLKREQACPRPRAHKRCGDVMAAPCCVFLFCLVLLALVLMLMLHESCDTTTHGVIAP